MSDFFSWMKSWGICGWIGFIIICSFATGGVIGIIRALTGHGPKSYKREVIIYCPECGYKDARQVEKYIESPDSDDLEDDEKD